MRITIILKIIAISKYLLFKIMELIFDDERVILSEGDTITVPPNVWHEAICKEGGKMLTVFHKGRFDQYLSKLSIMTDEEFADAELMNQINSEFDIYS